MGGDEVPHQAETPSVGRDETAASRPSPDVVLGRGGRLALYVATGAALLVIGLPVLGAGVLLLTALASSCAHPALVPGGKSAVPEPGALLAGVLYLGLAWVWVWRRRRARVLDAQQEGEEAPALRSLWSSVSLVWFALSILVVMLGATWKAYTQPPPFVWMTALTFCTGAVFLSATWLALRNTSRLVQRGLGGLVRRPFVAGVCSSLMALSACVPFLAYGLFATFRGVVPDTLTSPPDPSQYASIFSVSDGSANHALPETRLKSCFRMLAADPVGPGEHALRRLMREGWARYEAEDIVQDTVLSVCLNHAKESKENLAAYFTKSVHQNAQKIKKRRRPHVPLSSCQLDDHWIQPPSADTYSVRRAFCALSGDSRDMLLRHTIQGHTHREIAGELGLTEGAVAKRCSRARQELRDELQRQESPRRRRTNHRNFYNSGSFP